MFFFSCAVFLSRGGVSFFSRFFLTRSAFFFNSFFSRAVFFSSFFFSRGVFFLIGIVFFKGLLFSLRDCFFSKELLFFQRGRCRFFKG